MTTWTRRAASAAALATMSASLVACGDDAEQGGEAEGSDTSSEASDFAEQEGADIRAAAGESMSQLESVRVLGDITMGGEEISLDLATSTGGDCTGTLALDGAEAEVLSVDGRAWFRPSDEFWAAQAGPQADQIIELVDGRWVVLGEEDGFAGFCDLDQLLDELVDANESGSTYETGEQSEVEGIAVVAVESTDEDGGSSTGYVAVEEPHHLVQIVKTEGEDTGTVTFSEFDEPIEVEAPADDDMVDLDSL